MAKPVIRVLHHFARSGGTLIGKCLGCMDGIYLLSEIHPQNANIQKDQRWAGIARGLNPLAQAVNWHQLLTQNDLQQIQKTGGMGFSQLMLKLAGRAEEHGGCLLVRDWTHLDFVARPFLNQPTHRLTTAETLREVADVRQHITVRHPIDQLISLNRLTIIQGQIDTLAYMIAYQRFAELAQQIGFTRYEDFTRDPDTHTRSICEQLDLPFDPAYAQRWPDYKKITGDSSTAREIKPVERKFLDDEQMKNIRAMPAYQAAIESFGYEP